MNKVLKKKWVKALRSGRYKQTLWVLQNQKGENCCLGVLCRVAHLRKQSYENGDVYFDDVQTKLSDTFRYKIGLSTKDEDTLMQMNDTQHYSFKDIAKWIQKNL